jgi:hypothetical protein
MAQYVKLNVAGNQVEEIRDYAVNPATVKNCQDGNPMVRPLVDNPPVLEWWQVLAGTSYVIGPTEVVKEYNVQPKDLSTLKAIRSAQVDAALLARLEVGFSFGGKMLQVRPQDQSNIASAALRATLVVAAGGSWPNGFEWRMADNTFLAIPDAVTMLTMATQAMEFVVGLRQIAWAKKDAYAAFTTPEEIVAADPNTGWE